jgi:GNAT superfamily N-acetyltransferase
MIRIRNMTCDDLDLGLRLKDQAGWNQTAADWRRFLRLEPDGCFVAEWEGRPVGTTTTSVFQTVGWIAMVLVDETARHRGLGTRLVEHALSYLEQQGVQTIRLDATALGRPVYERLGFTAEYGLARWMGPAVAGPRPATVSLACSADLVAWAALDKEFTGTPRHRLLAELLADYPVNAGQVFEGDTLRGYVMFRDGSRAAYLGPAVARTAETGCALLDWAFAQCAGRLVFTDLPSDNVAALAWAKSHGLTVQRPFTRMCYGPRVGDQPACLWASSGPEKG